MSIYVAIDNVATWTSSARFLKLQHMTASISEVIADIQNWITNFSTTIFCRVGEKSSMIFGPLTTQI